MAQQKEDPDITNQDWFQQAMEEMENMHFSTPHIQNLFDDGTMRYYWVISLSRVVELTENGESQLGVLLVDMDYSSISRMMNQINESNSGQYYYLCDSNGEIIYHPSQIQISDGIVEENNAEAAKYKDGVYDESLDGENRKVIVNTVSYTGWKLVGVIPYSTFTEGMLNIRYFIAMLMLLMAMMLVVINRVVSVRISSPILKLNESVKAYEAGEKPEIYIGGSLEIRHLGHSIQSSYEQIDSLMKKIVLEQNERRKSELDALQSQINPHFLYNTLDSVRGKALEQHNTELADMVEALAIYFRYSISDKNNIITLREELKNLDNYIKIQTFRFGDRFIMEKSYEETDDLLSQKIPKMTLQPLVENSLNHGIDSYPTGGVIKIYIETTDQHLFIHVMDNGRGMKPEQLAKINNSLQNGQSPTQIPDKSSGLALVNVDNRIKLYFGAQYGLHIYSTPNVGTDVEVVLPVSQSS